MRTLSFFSLPRDWGADLVLAMGFLTRIPLPDRCFASSMAPDLARAMRVFPLVGLLIGALGGGVFWLAHAVVPPLVAAWIALIVLIALTGALHEDGLADLADGLGARGGRDQRLEVMRDSRTGAFGVIALISALGLRAACLAAAPNGGAGLAALMAAAALSRAMIPAAMQVMPPARTDGLGAGAGQPDATQTAVAALMGIGAALMLLGHATPLALVGALAGTGLVVAVARTHLGGHTGDVLGAVQQVSELGILTMIAVGWR